MVPFVKTRSREEFVCARVMIGYLGGRREIDEEFKEKEGREV